MDTAELFASQWQDFQLKRQQLIDETDQLKRKLNSLTSEPAMRQLLEEKARLKKKVPDLKEEVEAHKYDIEEKLDFLGRRHRAVTDRRIQKELAAQVKRWSNRMEWQKKTGKYEVCVQIAEIEIWNHTAPIAEVEQAFRQEIAEGEQEQQAAQRILDETMARIATIEEHYRQTRQCLEGAILEAEQRLKRCRAEEVEWATQSRRHLEWILEHEPSYKDDVGRRYKERFPSDNLADLFPPTPMPTPTVQRINGKKRRSRSTSSFSPVMETVSTAPQPWRFWVTFNANDVGQELPQDREQFLRSLRSILDGAAYFSLDVKLVYDKLLATSRMSKQQRQEMNKVAGVEPLGWKVLRVGKKHRLFLSVYEEQRHIRFLPYPRKKSYSQH